MDGAGFVWFFVSVSGVIQESMDWKIFVKLASRINISQND